MKEEVENISNKEEEIMRKAAELEREMEAIRNAKVMVVVKQFEQQLLEDAEKEETRFVGELQEKYAEKQAELEEEKRREVADVQKLAESLSSQIEFLKGMLQDLGAKKGELESTFQAAVQGLRRQQEACQAQQKQKLLSHIEHKKAIFQQYLAQNQR